VVAVDAGSGEIPSPAQRGTLSEKVVAVEHEHRVAVHVGDRGDRIQDVGGCAKSLEGLPTHRRVRIIVCSEDEGLNETAATV
jgi:hypothetical protein